MDDDDDDELPLGAILSGRFFPDGQDLFEIEQRLVDVRKRLEEMRNVPLGHIRHRGEIARWSRVEQRLSQAQQISQEHVRESTAKTQVYRRLRDDADAERTNAETKAPVPPPRAPKVELKPPQQRPLPPEPPMVEPEGGDKAEKRPSMKQWLEKRLASRSRGRKGRADDDD
jgi:hypothetical protein